MYTKNVKTEESVVRRASKHASEGIHPGFETQGRHHQKVQKQGYEWPRKKGHVSYKQF